MSAQVYDRLPAPSRRYPLANAANNVQQAYASPQKAQQQPVKAGGSPPLPRQNTKTVPPSPPRIIVDRAHAQQYNRIGFLGEGGFARVYEVQDHRGSRIACKVVTRSSLKTKKAKTKLYAEIKIHRSLSHPNIVHFRDCFEDEENVYMTLELCPSGSLMDMLRRRRRFTEPEARFFMVQLVGACHYMHSHQVIHRDLKLGNLFLDRNMNVKVGDFGLAALIESEGERKKTICGTPNYIAPEVLFDTANGHSFEVDTWSIGVILYTLVVGRPPFQTKDVKTIYKRIRENDYAFPEDRPVSPEAQDLVQQILTPDPQQRPSLHEILEHRFFIRGTVPAHVPTSAFDHAPEFRSISRSQSQLNLARLRRQALLDEDQVTSIAVPKAPAPVLDARAVKGPASSLAQQEKEFQRAIQPGSPISALLSSARQPLVVANSPGPRTRESPLLRKLQAAAPRDSPKRGRGAGLQNIAEEDPIYARSGADNQRKELDAQKARIVAQMAPSGSSRHPHEDQENVAPVRKESKGKERAVDVGRLDAPLPPLPAATKLVGLDAVADTLQKAFDARSKGKVWRDPRFDVALNEERVFIVSWVDYCNKYGMGYALTDGSVGVYFNDSSTLVLSPDKHHFDHITARKQGMVYVRKNYSVSEYPDDLKTKVYLLKHFEKYIMDRLYGEYSYTFEDSQRSKGMDFVQKYLRMKHVIVFIMNHDVLQFNFYDHTKLILSSQGLLVTYIDKNYQMTRWTTSQIMASSLQPDSLDPDQAKLQQRLVEKLKFCLEVLTSIKTASAEVALGSSVAAKENLGTSTQALGTTTRDRLGVSTRAMGVSTRASKASLR